MESKIHVLSFGLVNAYLVQGEKNILVDTGPTGQYDNLVEKVKACGVEMEDIALIVITHAHSDHYGNVSEIKKHFDIKTAIHEFSFHENREVHEIEAIPNGFLPKVLKLLFTNVKTDSFIPDVSMTDGFDFDDYGIFMKAIHVPGHTEDSVALVVNENKLIVGDLIRGTRKNKPREAMFLNNREAYLKSVKRIIEYHPTKIYCSHGSVLEGNGIKALENWV